LYRKKRVWTLGTRARGTVTPKKKKKGRSEQTPLRKGKKKKKTGEKSNKQGHVSAPPSPKNV